MKKRISAVLVALFLFGFTGSASALFFSDTIYQNVWLNSQNPSFTWHFDLNNDVLDWGNIDSHDEINSAYLWFGTYDQHDGYEFSDISLNLYEVVTNWEVDSGWWSLGNVTAFINADHLLNVTFDRRGGDFGVSWINLHGDYTDSDSVTAAPVPEPGTLLLLATGVAGIAATSRRRWHNRKSD